MTDRDAQQIQRAMLADIPIALIVAELERRGYTVVLVANRTVQEIAEVMANADDKRPPWPATEAPADSELRKDGEGWVAIVRREFERTFGPRWPPLADDDGPLPFEVGDE